MIALVLWEISYAFSPRVFLVGALHAGSRAVDSGIALAKPVVEFYFMASGLGCGPLSVLVGGPCDGAGGVCCLLVWMAP